MRSYYPFFDGDFDFCAFANLELIAEEIEDPFGTDTNDLPTDFLSANIYRNV